VRRLTVPVGKKDANQEVEVTAEPGQKPMTQATYASSRKSEVQTPLDSSVRTR
jgi:hypothetical protein